MIAYEVDHYLKRKRQGIAMLKIDMSKAYDHIKWQFSRHMMLKLGFHPAWVERIMLCVSTMSYMLSKNGEELGPIHPKKGLRQGIPLTIPIYNVSTDSLTRLVLYVGYSE